MGDHARGEAEGVADPMQVIAELNDDGHFTSRTCNELSIGRQRVQGTEEAQAVNEFANEGVDWDHAFGLELAEGDMNGPLIRAGGAQAIEGQIGALADAHAGAAEQQEDVCAQIVAAQELLFEELILLCSEWPWQGVGRARNVFASQQVREFGQLVGPGQLVEDRAESEEAADAGGGRKGWSLRTQARHPSEDVRIAAQLLDASKLGMRGGQIDEEVADDDVVVTRTGSSKCGA